MFTLFLHDGKLYSSLVCIALSKFIGYILFKNVFHLVSFRRSFCFFFFWFLAFGLIVSNSNFVFHFS